MSEQTFHIVVAVATVLACIGFTVQAGTVLMLLRAVRRMQAKMEPLAGRVEPLIDKLGPVIDKASVTVERAGAVLDTSNQILRDARPRIADLSDEAVAMSRAARKHVDRLGEIVVDAGGRARDRLEQIDETVGATVEQVGEVGGAVKRALKVPVREANGIAAGISAAMSTIVRGSRKSSVDHATQDEEMFI